MKQVGILAAVATVLLSAVAAQAADLSGTYVATGPGAAYLVEIVETGGQVTGRYEQQVLKSGKIDGVNAALTGAEDNGTLVLNLKPNGLLTGTITLSGTSDGQALHLAGGGFDLHLVRADDATWAADVASLGGQAKAVNDRAAEVAALGQLETYVKYLDDFVAKADAAMPHFPVVEHQLHAITAQMRGGLDRERGTLGSVARGQIDVAIYQASIGGTQLWGTVQSTWSDFQNKTGALGPKTAGIRQLCDGVLAGTTGTTDAAQAPRWTAGCTHALKSITAYDGRVQILTAAFRHINGVWAAEGPAQAAIVKSADAAEQ